MVLITQVERERTVYMAKINSWRTSFDIEGEPTGGGNAKCILCER